MANTGTLKLVQAAEKLFAAVPTYIPSFPWVDGQKVTRIADGVLFVYSASLNTLTISPNISGAIKNAGNLIISNLPSPNSGGDAANKTYVDTHVGGGGGISEAPTDGGTYARFNTAWTSTLDGGAY
jgi:hypothetical protein